MKQIILTVSDAFDDTAAASWTVEETERVLEYGRRMLHDVPPPPPPKVQEEGNLPSECTLLETEFMQEEAPPPPLVAAADVASATEAAPPLPAENMRDLVCRYFTTAIVRQAPVQEEPDLLHVQLDGTETAVLISSFHGTVLQENDYSRFHETVATSNEPVRAALFASFQDTDFSLIHGHRNFHFAMQGEHKNIPVVYLSNVSRHPEDVKLALWVLKYLVENLGSVRPSPEEEDLVKIVRRIARIHAEHVDGYNALVQVYEGLRKQLHAQREIKNNLEDLVEDSFRIFPGLKRYGVCGSGSGGMGGKSHTQQYTRNEVLDLIIKHLDEKDIPEFLRINYSISGRRINELGGIKQLRKEVQLRLKANPATTINASTATTSMVEEFDLET
jgi:hypothetical protein